MVVSILIAVISAAALLLILMSFAGKKSKIEKSKNAPAKVRSKNRSAIIRECSKKLSHDPHNVQALKDLGEIYYEEQQYEKALPIYSTLFKLANMHVEIEKLTTSLRFGVCSYKQGNYDDSFSGLTSALKMDPKIFEANLYLGETLYFRKDYERAIVCLKRALSVNNESAEAMQYLAYCLYQAKKYRECLPFLKKTIENYPENKEALFFMASAMEEAGMSDKALKIFMHLRPDPVYGPQACLFAGSSHDKMKDYEKAILDYEIALKLETIRPETKLAIYYKIAQSYLNMHNISKALYYLKQIQALTPNYKDVNQLVNRYQELNQNSNLKAYLMSGTTDFVVLCRKFVTSYYPDSVVKIEDISVASESIEVLCSVEGGKWEDTQIFRFFRSSGAIGELYVRDLHSKMRDIKCDRGFCVTAGSFTEEARKYVDGRPIDLIEKNKLTAILKKMDISR